MSKLLLSLAIGITAPMALAQNCFTANPPGTVISASAGDTILPMQPIGFAFPLAGSTYTNIHISDHGLAFLSNGGVPTPPVATPLVYTPTTASFTANGPMLCCLWTDYVGSGVNAKIYIDSQPTQCTVTWWHGSNFGIPLPEWSAQMILFPTGEVIFNWGVGATNNSTFGSPSDQGICGITPGGGAALPTAVDLSTGPVTANNTVYEWWSVANTFDMANTGLRLIPTSPGWAVLPLGNPTNCATVSDYGVGCGGGISGGVDSIYEAFNSSTFDLAGTTLTWLRTGTGYAVTTALPGTFVTPSLSAVPVAPGALDGQTQFVLSQAMPFAGGTTTYMNVTTKGQVELSGVAGGIDWTPTAGELLNWPNTVFCCWHDMYQGPGGAGTITFEQAGGIAYVTFDGVMSLSSTLTNTFQFQFNETTGDVSLVIVSANGISDPNNFDACVVGYSVGGASVDPGATNLGSFPGVIQVDDTAATVITPNLALTSFGGNPYIGNAGFGYTVTGVPAIVPLTFLFFGDTIINPGVSLNFIGMTGCSAFTNANLGSFTTPVVGGTATFPLGIPSTPSLAGTALTTQALAFSFATPANLIASNGTSTLVGN